jgi:gluconolactonase
MPVIEILLDGLDHPEGVCWDPAAEVLWAGGEAGQVYRVDLQARQAEEVARAPRFVLGLAVDGRGRVVCANHARWQLALVQSRLRGAPPHYPDAWAVDA